MTDDSTFGSDDPASGEDPGTKSEAQTTDPGQEKTEEENITDPVDLEAPSKTDNDNKYILPNSGPGVNSIIIDAVNKSNTAVLGASGDNGASIAYQKVAQASAFAVQDSTDYLRNIMAMSSATTGVALQKMVANPAEAESYAAVIAFAALAVTGAQLNFAAVGSEAGTVVKNFPSS